MKHLQLHRFKKIIWLGLDGKFTSIQTDDVTSILKLTLNN